MTGNSKKKRQEKEEKTGSSTCTSAVKRELILHLSYT